MLKHILSAVQNSIEEAAIDAARTARVTTAGWIPQGFRQRQPPGRCAKPLQPGRLTAFGIQELTLRTNPYARADEHNLLAADLTLLISCRNEAPSRFVVSRRDRIVRFGREYGLPLHTVNLGARDICDVISAMEDREVETLLVVSLQEEPDDQVLKNEALDFFGKLLKRLPTEYNATAPCMEPRINRDNWRYPVYAYARTKRKPLLSCVKARAKTGIDRALNALKLTAEKRQSVGQTIEKEVAAAIHQVQAKSFESFLNLPCFFAGTIKVSCRALGPAQWEQMFELCVLRATYHKLQDPLWWPNRSVPKSVRELFEETRISSIGICSRQIEYGHRPDHSGRHALRDQREEAEMQLRLFCEVVAATDLLHERGLRTYLMLILAGLSTQSEVREVVNTIARQKFQVGRDRFLYRFRNLWPSQLILNLFRRGEDQGREIGDRHLWQIFKKLGRSLRNRHGRSDSCQIPERRISNGNQVDREDDLFYFVDEFPFVTEYWTPEHLVRFREEMCELIGSDRDRWEAWLAGAP